MSPTRYIVKLDPDFINHYLSLFNTLDFNQSTLWDFVLEYVACVDYSLDKESFLDGSMDYILDIMTKHPRFLNDPEYFTDKFIGSIIAIGDFIAPTLRHLWNNGNLHRLTYVHYYHLTGELIVDLVEPIF